jgi:CBS domain-containing protein
MQADLIERFSKVAERSAEGGRREHDEPGSKSYGLEGGLEPLMQAPLPRVQAHTSALDVLRLVELIGVHYLVVFDERQLLGIVCSCDLEELPLAAPARTAELRAPIAVEVTSSVEAAAARCREACADCLIVTRRGEPIGLVSADMLDAAQGHVPADYLCESCGGPAHARAGKRGVLCPDCRESAAPALPDTDEHGGSG